MGDQLLSSTLGIITAIIGIAIVAILVAKKSDTANVIGSGSKAFSSLVSQAVSPVSHSGSLT